MAKLSMREETLSPIEFVFFDLGNVLLSFDPDVACKNVSRRFGVSIEAARRAIYDSDLQNQFERGQLTGESFAEGVRAALARSRDQVPTSELLDAVSDMFLPVDSMPEALQAVRVLGCLSDCSPIPAMHIGTGFDVSVIRRPSFALM